MKTLPLGLLLLAAGCAEEHDVTMYIVLPQIAGVCDYADVAYADVHVTGDGPEDFTFRATPCMHDPTLMFDGFERGPSGPLVLDRLLGDWYRVDVSLFSSAGSPRGQRHLPFLASHSPLVVDFARGDLVGWPATPVTLDLTTCAVAADLANVRLRLTPEAQAYPSVDMTVPCARPGPTTAQATVPRGPFHVLADGFGADGTACYRADVSVTVLGPTAPAVELRLERLCFP
ncbi:MAG TPA: hypothetical protein VKE22_30720 [Haliangiales bacterium]|nr:hypothetical protein [Haliangiales bacterium]